MHETPYLVRIGDPAYPTPLTELHDPPRTLYVRGALKIERAVAVVGTRKMTAYGRYCAELFAGELARLGMTVVSGLALGVDGAAHEAALAAGGHTVAVLGSGIDDRSVYPRAHLDLAKRMIDAGGAVISEYAPGTPSYKDHFPKRNRIVAGLSEAVLVVEAPARSGAMITARLALKEGRDVWAVPGPVTHPNSEGVHRLIRQGAVPITCKEDIYEVLGVEASPETMRLSEDEEKIVAALRAGVRDAAGIAAHARLALPDSTALLTALELRGAVRQLDDGSFALYDAS